MPSAISASSAPLRDASTSCGLCGRSGLPLTRHHLIPRTLHRSRGVRKAFGKLEPRTRIAFLCHACHKTVHATLTEKELARSYHSVEALAAHPEIARFVEWVRKQDPNKRVHVRTSGTKSRRRG